MAELLPELKRGRSLKYSDETKKEAIAFVAETKDLSEGSKRFGIPKPYLSKLYNSAREKALLEQQGSSEASSESSVHDTSALEGAATLKSEV